MIIVCDSVATSSSVKSTCCIGQGSNTNTMSDTDGRTYTERRRRRAYHFFFLESASNCRFFVYSLFVFISTVISNCSSAHSIVCDFNGSGLDMVGKGIQPVYLSCSSGRVDWRHPRSALRIVLQYPPVGEKRDFQGCIKASPEIEGARLFLEGYKNLLPLYSKGDGKPKKRKRCFKSEQGLAALYLEADPSLGFTDLKASFQYDLQPLPKGSNTLQECRPCTVTELVQFYCSADFAAKGFIIATEDDESLQQTKVILAATKVFQQTSPVFSKDKSPFYSPNKTNHLNINFYEELDQNLIPEDGLTNNNSLYGHLYMPIECGARAGDGEFMVLGNMRLGQPMLRCAPRIQQWQQIVKSAQDRAHCVLET